MAGEGLARWLLKLYGHIFNPGILFGTYLAGKSHTTKAGIEPYLSTIGHGLVGIPSHVEAPAAERAAGHIYLIQRLATDSAHIAHFSVVSYIYYQNIYIGTKLALCISF